MFTCGNKCKDPLLDYSGYNQTVSDRKLTNREFPFLKCVPRGFVSAFSTWLRKKSPNDWVFWSSRTGKSCFSSLRLISIQRIIGSFTSPWHVQLVISSVWQKLEHFWLTWVSVAFHALLMYRRTLMLWALPWYVRCMYLVEIGQIITVLLLFYYWALWAILTHRYSLENIKPHM